MAHLITCIECGARVSSDAAACVKCGKNAYGSYCSICNRYGKAAEFIERVSFNRYSSGTATYHPRCYELVQAERDKHVFICNVCGARSTELHHPCLQCGHEPEIETWP